MLNILKNDLFLARKAKDKLRISLLSTLIGEAEMIGKNSGNRESSVDEVLSTVRKFIKNAEETLSKLKYANMDSIVVETEIKILKAYLPKMMSQQELQDIVIVFHNENRPLGEMMRYLKDNYNGLYDGKLASTLFRNYLLTPNTEPQDAIAESRQMMIDKNKNNLDFI